MGGRSTLVSYPFNDAHHIAVRPTKLKTIFKSQEIKVVVGILRWRISGGWGKMKISSMQPPSEWNLA